MPDKTKAIFSRVLERIKPTRHELAEERALSRRIIGRLQHVLPPQIGVELVGSIAKDTHLRGDRDIDIFLLFPQGSTREDLVKKGLEYAKKALKPGEKWHVGYAEHPYLKAEIEGSEVELVPCFKIREITEKASSADRSPLHCRYVLEFLNEAGCDEVRLLKAFMKRQGIYGAEIKIEGFSGYLCELMIIEFGSFKKLLEVASNWNTVPVLDPENHHADKNALRGKFPGAAMVMIDPVDPSRNVAASVSSSSLSKFILAARAFLKNPSEEYFAVRKMHAGKDELAKLKKKFLARGTEVVALGFNAPEVIEDILWPQLRKAAKNIVRTLEENDFRLFGNGYWADESTCLLLFEFEVPRMPKIRKVLGPDVKHAKACVDFINAHRNAIAGPWVEGNRLVAAEPRKYIEAKDLIHEIALHPQKYGIPSHVSKTIGKWKQVPSSALFTAKYAGFVHEYVEKKELSVKRA